jgi:hypothetical protein
MKTQSMAFFIICKYYNDCRCIWTEGVVVTALGIKREKSAWICHSTS